MLRKPEIYRVVNGYIEVHGGYLGDFSYRTHREFYPYYCEVDINPDVLSGTTRERFLSIIEGASAHVQAKILRGVLAKYPVSCFPEEQRDKKAELAREIQSWIARLEAGGVVEHPDLASAGDAVSRAIDDARTLLRTSDARSAVDRVHTALHGYLKEVARSADIDVGRDDSLTDIYKRLRQEHPQLRSNPSGASETDRIVRAMSTMMDALNTIRNRLSVAHPNETLLEEPEALLAVNVTYTMLTYLASKLRKETVGTSQ